jgi:hypothetical protein
MLPGSSIRLTVGLRRSGRDVVRFDDDAETEEAVNLYQWAIRCVREQAYTPWPEGAPRPTRTPVHGSGLHLANEVFLTCRSVDAIARAGHLERNHPFLTSSRSLDEEHEADFFATDHVLGGVTDEDVRFKRSVGIVVANALLLLLELMNGPVAFPDTSTHRGAYQPESSGSLNLNPTTRFMRSQLH